MISVTILVKNGARTLRKVLEAASLFEEIILYDTGSEDGTLEIATTFPRVKIYQKQFNGFGPSHNDAASLATHDWILSIDADEVLSERLLQEIASLKLKSGTLYAIPFINFFNGKQIKWCGWYPEKHIRLYNKRETAFSEALVHEGVIKKELAIETLQHPIHHYPYGSINDFLIKMERYSSLFAVQNYKKRRASLPIALIHGWGAFIKSFVLKRGFMGGFEGFLISTYNGHTAFYKYLKLYQMNKR